MELVIELGRHDRNINVFVEPLAESRRGSWRNAAIPGGRYNERLGVVPDLPGYRVALDTSAKTLRVFDPLGEPESKHDLVDVQTAFRKRDEQYNPAKERKVDRLPEEKVARWLEWMQRVVESGNATLMRGQFPKPEKQRQLATA